MFLNQKFIQYRKVGGGFPLPSDRFWWWKTKTQSSEEKSFSGLSKIQTNSNSTLIRMEKGF